jgi:hypothetical protein
MVEVFGEYYYIDIDKITEVCELVVNEVEKENEESPSQLDQTINVFKYDAIKLCMDTVFTENTSDDNGLGLLNSELSIPFGFAFNTLIKYGILVKSDE